MDKVKLKQYVRKRFSINQLAKEFGKGQTTIRYWLKKFKLKTKHSIFPKRTWTDKQLKEALVSSFTISKVIQKLGLTIRPGNYYTVKKYITKLGLDTSHIVGKAHGTSGFREMIPTEQLLVKNCKHARQWIKKRILKYNLLENKCSLCDQKPIWQEKVLIMVLDHINGINNDYRIENLRFLCPNCNSQQKTFCRKKNGQIAQLVER